MKVPAHVSLLGIAAVFAVVSYTQSRPSEIQSGYENLDFAKGRPGELPPGWRLGPEGTRDYAAEIVSAASCTSRKQCATVRSIGIGRKDLSFLYQTFDAAPYRGKRLAFRASVRAEVSGLSVARLLVRVYRNDGSTSFRDDMGNHAIRSGPWAVYEIAAPSIASDARDIEFGMQLVGEGVAWIDKISLNFSD